jgi:hypothetical protein
VSFPARRSPYAPGTPATAELSPGFDLAVIQSVMERPAPPWFPQDRAIRPEQKRPPLHWKNGGGTSRGNGPMFGYLARKTAIRTGCVVAFGLLATSVSATARDGTMPFDTVACRDKSIIQGFADRMRATTPDQFWMYVDELIRTGQCDKIFQGEPVAFTPLNDGGTCLSIRANEPCYWSVAQAATFLAPAIATRTEPTTTGQAASPETTGSVAPQGQTTTIVRTTTTIIRPGERPVTRTETRRTTR